MSNFNILPPFHFNNNNENYHENIARQYSPYLRFQLGEKYFPIEYDEFINNSYLQYKNPKWKNKKIQNSNNNNNNNNNSDNNNNNNNDNDNNNKKKNEKNKLIINKLKKKKKKKNLKLIKNIKNIINIQKTIKKWKNYSNNNDNIERKQCMNMELLLNFIENKTDNEIINYRLMPKKRIKKGSISNNIKNIRCYARLFPRIPNDEIAIPLRNYFNEYGICEIKYIFFYSWNGAKFENITSMGEHPGDCEHITVRIDNRDGEILEAYFAAHSFGEGKWIPSEDSFKKLKNLWKMATNIDFEPKKHLYLKMKNKKHIKIFPGFHGHPSYPNKGREWRFSGFGSDLHFGNGVKWHPNVLLLSPNTINKHPWLKYKGKFGSTWSLLQQKWFLNPGEENRKISLSYQSLLLKGPYDTFLNKGSIDYGLITISIWENERRKNGKFKKKYLNKKDPPSYSNNLHSEADIKTVNNIIVENSNHIPNELKINNFYWLHNWYINIDINQHQNKINEFKNINNNEKRIKKYKNLGFTYGESFKQATNPKKYKKFFGMNIHVCRRRQWTRTAANEEIKILFESAYSYLYARDNIENIFITKEEKIKTKLIHILWYLLENEINITYENIINEYLNALYHYDSDENDIIDNEIKVDDCDDSDNGGSDSDSDNESNSDSDSGSDNNFNNMLISQSDNEYSSSSDDENYKDDDNDDDDDDDDDDDVDDDDIYDDEGNNNNNVII